MSSIADWLDNQIQRHSPPGPEEMGLALGVATRIAAAGVALRDGRGLVFGFDMSSEDRMALSPVSSRCFATVAQWHTLFRSQGFANGCLSLERDAAAKGFGPIGEPLEVPDPLELVGFRGRLHDVPLNVVESGIFKLRTDGPTLSLIASQAAERYQGPHISGLDVVLPNDAGTGWILLDGWESCFQDPSFSVIASNFGKALDLTTSLHNAGVSIDGDLVTVSTGSLSKVVSSSLIAVLGELPFPIGQYSPETRDRFWASVETIDAYLGVHMGRPHWFGHGITYDGNRIASVTPYLGIRMRASCVEIAATHEAQRIQTWLHAFEAATASFDRN